ncbi:MAG: hypothetical protein KGO94_08130, partial [Alphaproteobacteria bacterium]|nr:hypothetical protein [Alphaproteobacteria bacterium]
MSKSLVEATVSQRLLPERANSPAHANPVSKIMLQPKATIVLNIITIPTNRHHVPTKLAEKWQR